MMCLGTWALALVDGTAARDRRDEGRDRSTDYDMALARECPGMQEVWFMLAATLQRAEVAALTGAVSDELRRDLRALARTLAALGLPSPLLGVALAAEAIAFQGHDRSSRSGDRSGLPEGLPDELAQLLDEAQSWIDGLGSSHLTALSMALQSLERDAVPGEALAWLFRFIHDAEGSVSGREQIAEGRLRKHEGARLLRSTQFFTDEYMVEFLVRRAMANVDVGSVRIVDPACGGGNFLIASLRLLAAREGHDPKRVAAVLRDRLVGFDIDPEVASVARVALWAEAVQLTGCVDMPLGVAHVIEHPAGAGILDRLDLRVAEEFSYDGQVAVLTNPPFLGRRLMPHDLRALLRHEYPDAGNELCNAMLLRCAELARPGDVIAAVHPLVMLHLDSYRATRDRLSQSLAVVDRVLVGPGAFKDLGGEKASVALSVWQATDTVVEPDEIWDFTHIDVKDRVRLIRSIAANGDSTEAEGFRRSTVGHKLPGRPYSEVADVLQGTSTGDAKRFLRYWWEIPPDDARWRAAAKGGGHLRWAGLTQFSVLWGEGGELVASNPGSAIRNVHRQDDIRITYSDSFSRGLSARVAEHGAVSIAGGPGIIPTVGASENHLAFLNSRYATWQLRSLSPKLVASPGYVARMLCDEGFLVDPEVRRLSSEAIRCARRLDALRSDSRTDTAADEFTIEAERSRYIRQLELEAELATVEEQLDQLVLDWHIASAAVRGDIDATVGVLSATGMHEADPQTSRQIVRAFRKAAVPELRRAPRTRMRMLGVRGIVEQLALEFAVHPREVARLGSRTVDEGHIDAIIIDSLLHRSFLSCMDGMSRQPEGATTAAIEAATDLTADFVRGWIEDAFEPVHASMFHGRPRYRYIASAREFRAVWET